MMRLSCPLTCLLVICAYTKYVNKLLQKRNTLINGLTVLYMFFGIFALSSGYSNSKECLPATYAKHATATATFGLG